MPLGRAIGSLAVPAILSFLLHNFYHVNDTWFLGRFAPPEATNAMGLFMMVSIANFGFILALARGTQSLVGRRLGAGNRPGVPLALAQGLRLALMVVVPLAVLEWIYVPDLLRLVGGEGETVVQGTAYVRALLLLLPGLFASPILEFSLQGMGDTRTPFKLQLLAVGVNTLFNFLLVPEAVTLGAGGPTLHLAGMGVVGAALATGFSRCVTAALAFAILVRRERMTALLARSSYAFDRRMAAEILRVGVPAGSSTFLFALVGFYLTRLIGEVDQSALGGYAIGFRGVESLSFMVVLGFGVAAGAVTSHAVGAGDLPRARRAAHLGALLCAGVMAITTTLFLTLPERLCSIYTDDPAILAVAAGYISHMALCQIPQAFEMVYGDAMAGAGSSGLAALVSIPGNLLRVPLAWWLAVELDMGLLGVWYAIVASAMLKGLGMALLFVSPAWEKAMQRGRSLLA
ncbi:MAG: MATE family efflux transporter [Planctomycetes bacterium]|nr:MATE family efflux transporter [Planctomycetota bacterium]